MVSRMDFSFLLHRKEQEQQSLLTTLVDASPQQAPPWLVWLRYNLFFVLYPVGILSEMRMVHLAIRPAEKVDGRLAWMLWGVLAVYVPGMYDFSYFIEMLLSRRV